MDITNRNDVVSICYSTWFKPVASKAVIYDNTEILAGRGEWGPYGSFHYWAKPALGYYTITEEVVRTHMQLLQDAGVDFIIIDNTNCNSSWVGTGYFTEMVEEPCNILLNTILKMRSEGKMTPCVVFWSKNGIDPKNIEYDWVLQKTYDMYYESGKYDECFVYWDGKPFMITTSEVPVTMKDKFTMRKMWGLQKSLKTEEWVFLQKWPQNVSKSKDDLNEQTCVCAALQQTYMTESTAIGRRGGYTFWEQWKLAFDEKPKVVTITWWNEWIAQKFEDDKGNPRYVDNYNSAFSRDIEPMDPSVEGGHGDKYYKWMCEYIKVYRSNLECPKLTDF